jgi:hypothetical protein
MQSIYWFTQSILFVVGIVVAGFKIHYDIEQARFAKKQTQISDYKLQAEQFENALKNLSHELMSIRIGAINILSSIIIEQQVYSLSAFQVLIQFIKEKATIPIDHPISKFRQSNTNNPRNTSWLFPFPSVSINEHALLESIHHNMGEIIQIMESLATT